MQQTISGVTIEFVQGDIAGQHDITCVVNAANAQLRMGGGVAGAIHRAAGPGLAEETRAMAPISPGEAVISGGHDLPNEYVIHCLGPVYGRDKPEDQLLGNCFENALRLAEDHEIDSVAFPAISTGAFGYPTREAATVSLETVLEQVPTLEAVHQIRFVLYDRKTLNIFKEAFEALTERADS
jgi:O-acetyl-ADP-ribose deacetylase (regulator of RNase III)